MCLYPKLILNRKYLPNKKNNYNPPPMKDERLKYVAVGCGNCIECRHQKARNWQIRLNEEIKGTELKYFVTLTFNDENFIKLQKLTKTKDVNEIASIAIRRFLERYRKKYKHSIKHFLITELGENNTERLHLHGILFSRYILTNEELQEIWSYGKSDTGEFVNEKTINYITKYITKIDRIHKHYKPDIFCSAGLGKSYTENEYNKSRFKYKPGNTREFYIYEDGHKGNLPIYYRNKFFNEETREMLWQDRLDKKTIYVRGIEIDISSAQGYDTYMRILKQQQQDNINLGYGDDSETWSEKTYRAKLKEINAIKKIICTD